MPRHRQSIIATAALVALVLAACGSDVPANDVQIGQCTNQDLTASVGEIATVDCQESHTAEVFAIFDFEGDDFPGADAIENDAVEGCIGDRFEDYVGVPYQQSEIFSAPVAPTEQTWNEADDRTVICFAVASDGSPSQGSVRGAKR